jgi:hypothetical protein
VGAVHAVKIAHREKGRSKVGGHVFEFVEDLHGKMFNRTVCRDFAKNAKELFWKASL